MPAPGYLLALVYLSEPPSASLAPHVLQILDALGVGRVALVVDREGPDEDPVAEAEAELLGATAERPAVSDALADPAVLSMTALAPGPRPAEPRVAVTAHLRFSDGTEPAERAPRSLHVIAPPESRDALEAWLVTCAAQLSVLHGGIATFSTYAEASVEAWLVGRNGTPPSFEPRRTYDSRRRTSLWTHARRVYDTTLLGAVLARRAGSPPPGVTVTETSTGSMFVHDASPVARRWLWPYTLQNPVDAELEPATVVLATVGRLVLESPTLQRCVLRASLPHLVRGQTVHVAHPGRGDRLLVVIDRRTLAFDAAGALLDDFTLR